jgi:7-alpha-hydroxysteroid dehydrogenase
VTGRLAGRTAIVTGASRGLGAVVAGALAADGCAVAVVARTESQWNDRLPGTIHETAERIVAAGGRATAIVADVSVPEDLERIVRRAEADLGPVSILVNNAALTAPGRPARPAAAAAAKPPRPAGFESFPVTGYRRHLEVGLLAPMRLMQLTVPKMAAAGRGAVINVSSDAAFRPGPGPYRQAEPALNLAYGGTKAALQHLTMSVACEVARRGVSVNALLPSQPIQTPGLMATTGYAGPVGSADEFAEAVVRLCLADPDVCTGQVLYHEDVLHPDRPPRGWVGAV